MIVDIGMAVGQEGQDAIKKVERMQCSAMGYAQVFHSVEEGVQEHVNGSFYA